MAGNQVTELEQYPKFKQNYINAFDRMMKRRIEAGKKDYEKEGIHKWTDGESVYRWWVGDTTPKEQMTIFVFLDKDNDEK